MFKNQEFYVLPTLYLGVLNLSWNKYRRLLYAT